MASGLKEGVERERERESELFFFSNFCRNRLRRFLVAGAAAAAAAAAFVRRASPLSLSRPPRIARPIRSPSSISGGHAWQVPNGNHFFIRSGPSQSNNNALLIVVTYNAEDFVVGIARHCAGHRRRRDRHHCHLPRHFFWDTLFKTMLPSVMAARDALRRQLQIGSLVV